MALDTLAAALIAVEDNADLLRGPEGEQGPQGDTGADGPAGPEGPQGPQGLTGIDGRDGLEGPRGAKGDRGPKGDKGDRGEKGERGPAGPSGTGLRRAGSVTPTGGIGGIVVQDEGVVLGTVQKINAVGSGVVASVSGDTATITVSGGGGGGGSSADVTDGSTTVTAPGIIKAVGVGATAVVSESPSGTAVITITADAAGAAAAAQAAAEAASDPLGSAAAVTTTSIGAVPTARTITAGTGLTGGGDLSANRTVAADFGSGAGKVTQGNDSRLSDARTPTAHKTSHQSGGSDAIDVTGLTGLPTRASLGLDTTDSPQFAGVNVGAATDTTITRVSAGVIAVEGATVLAGNLSGDVSSSGLVTTIGAGKVTEAMQVLANNTTGNVTTGRHGYVPILPNDATKFLDGTGAFAVPTASAALTYASATLGSPVGVNTSTFTDILSVSLAAGTWLVMCSVEAEATIASVVGIEIKLWDGTNLFGSSDTVITTGPGLRSPLVIIAPPIVLGTTTTVKISGKSVVQAAQISSSTTTATTAKASQLVAVKIA